MKAIHCIAGVPRSGSTLLCNILNQNPEFFATDTSPLPELMSAMTQRVSASPEIQGLLDQDSEAAQERIRGLFRSMIKSWYSDTDKIVFDKSRGWSFHAMLMSDLFPETRFIVTVRDLRNVFSSIEKHHRKAPFFDTANDPIAKTIYARADIMMAPQGMIGTSVTGLQDLMARAPNRVLVVNYESLARYPNSSLGELYDFLDMDDYKHDFENVENVSNEPDHLYLDKFPHNGEGKVKKTDRNEWRKYLQPDLATLIHGKYPEYNKLFGY